MTIGPLPMIRIDWMSVRFGISPKPLQVANSGERTGRNGAIPRTWRGFSSGVLGDQVGELGEEVAGVVGAGAGLGVVLDAEGADVAEAKAIDDADVEVDVADDGAHDR